MKKSLLGKTLQNHPLAMILCCAIPLGLIVILSLTGSLGSWGFYALILLCPVLHIFMMRGHGHTSSADHAKGHAPSADDTKRLIPAPDVTENPPRINEE